MVAGTVVTALAGGLFGLALAAPPGPMNAIIAQESVLRGWWAGVRAGLGAMTADALFFLLALVGVVTVVDSAPRLRALMVIAGGLLMLWFAVDTLGDLDTSVREGGGVPDGRGFRKALVLGLTNPYQILFWLTVGIGLLEPGSVDLLAVTPYLGDRLAGTLVVASGSPILVGGLFGGILVWILTFPTTLVRLGERVDPLSGVVAGGSALVLAGFGLLFVARGVGALLALEAGVWPL